jgi:hypothetical protein
MAIFAGLSVRAAKKFQEQLVPASSFVLNLLVFLNLFRISDFGFRISISRLCRQNPS